MGNVLAQVLNLGACYVVLIQQSCQLEVQMVNFERCYDMSKNVPLEEEVEVGKRRYSELIRLTQPQPRRENVEEPADCPVIELSAASFRYRHDIGESLRNLTVSFTAGQKVGIVGRTGAGKSSLTLAIARIIDLAGGSMLIDGENSERMQLAHLRSKISVIPQDPFIYEGTLRSNLDPYGLYSNEQLNLAVTMANLQHCRSLLKGLDSEVGNPKL